MRFSTVFVTLGLGALSAVACSETTGGGPADTQDASTADVGTPDPPDGSAPDAPPGSGFGSLGFKVADDGFAFENYGEGAQFTNLTGAELRRFFGDTVCATPGGDACGLTPSAQRWLLEQNKGMDGGHCEGMAALALLFFKKTLPVQDFGAATTGALALEGNTKLQREIAYWFVTQALDPTASGELKGPSPNEIVDAFAASLRSGATESYTIGIYKPGYKEGHAMTPIELRDLGGDKVGIVVYDNNYPKSERIVEVDRKANTWKYVASTNPSVPQSEYLGDATTKTLTLTPTTKRVATQQCPFCGTVEPNGAIKGNTIGRMEVWLDGKANLLVTDDGGKRFGHVGGAFVSEIAGGSTYVPRSRDLWQDDHEPVYRVPTGKPYTVTLDGTALAGKEPSDVSFVAPGYELAVLGVELDPNQKDTIQVSATGDEIVYTTNGSETPTIEIGLATDAADYIFHVKAFGEAAGQEIRLKLDRVTGELRVIVRGADAMASYDVEVIRRSSTGEAVFTHAGEQLGKNDAVVLKYAAWTGQGTPMKFGTDTGNDGTIDVEVDENDDN